MSTKPMKPLPKAQVKVDLSDAETMTCQQCDNKIFIQGYVVKRISAIVSPNGKEVIADSTLNIIPNRLLANNDSKNGKYGDLIDSFKDVGEGKCEFCKFQIVFKDKEALEKLKKHANCSRPSDKEFEYCILKKTARFVIDRFKKPLFTSDWLRSEQLPDYN